MNDFTLNIRGNTKDLLAKVKQATQGMSTFAKDATESLKTPQAQATQFASSLQSLGSVAKTALAGLVGGMGIKSLTKDFMDYHANLANATQVMKYNVTEVEALGGAMRRFGGDTQGAVSTLDNLSSALQQARWGQGALIETASKFGIQYMKSNGTLMSSEELLRSLSTQLNRFDKQTKVAIASQLGLDSALLRVIDSGNFDSMISQQKKLNLTTQQDLKIATDMESAWLDFRDSIASVAKELSRALLPPLTKLIRFLTESITALKEWKGTGTLAFMSVGVAVIPVVSKVSALVSMISSLSVGSKILGTLGAGFSKFGDIVKIALKPFSLVSMAIAGLLLIMDDLAAYNEGGESMFGDLIEKFPLLGTVVNEINTAFSTVIGTLKEVKDWISNFSLSQFIDNTISTVKNGLITVTNYFKSLLIAPLNFFRDMLASIIEKIPIKGKEWAQALRSSAVSSDEVIAKTAGPADLMKSSQSTVTNNTGGDITNNITINSNQDPKAIAREVIDLQTHEKTRTLLLY